MIYGYCRVSTNGQAHKFGLEQQKQEILKRYEHAQIFQEKYTGTKVDRPVFNELISKLEFGDTLVVAKLDRLARNTVEGIDIIKSLFDRGVAIHVLAIGLLENTTMGQLLITILLAVAEMERNVMLERTQAGKEIAKINNPNYREGRPPKYTPERLEKAIKFLEDGNSYSKTEKIYNISRATLHRKKKEKDSKINDCKAVL